MLALMLAQYNTTSSEAAGAGVAAAIFACYCAVIIVGLLLFAFWLWMLIDCIMRQEEEFPEGQPKTTWLLILIIGWIVGSFVMLSWLPPIFYFFMVYKKIPRAKA